MKSLLLLITCLSLSVSAELKELEHSLPTPQLDPSLEKAIEASWQTLSLDYRDRERLCKSQEKPRIQKLIPSAIATLSSSGVLELFLNNARLYIDFQPSSALVRISRPENPDDRNGMVLPFMSEARWAYLKGKTGWDAIIWVPPLAGCSHQFIAICPRVLKPVNVFTPISIQSASADFIWEAKADAVLIASAKEPGSARSTIRTTANSEQPVIWSDRSGGTKISSSLEYISQRSDRSAKISPSENLPFSGAIEARTSFDVPSSSPLAEIRMTVLRAEKVELKKQIKIRPQGYPAKLEPGSCVLITHYSEESLLP